jgi:hypothetical protein
MIQNIVQYLNLRLETLGRIADLHGISERRKRESDGANVPYCYVGSGEFKPVNIDNGNVGWWRARGGFNMEPVEVIGRAVRQQRATYPLRFVAVLRRELSTSDDAFMPSRLAEDIANALNFDNGDLRGILKAINVEARASGGEFDAATIWPTEFQTSIPDLRYELAMVAVDVTIEVVGRYSCWEGECATDTDILRLFNFCDPSVVARLTDAQRVCLEDAICPVPEDANWELFNTEGTLLSTGSIPSGDTDQIVAPDATVLRDGIAFGTVASGSVIDVPSNIPPCADATFSIDGVQVDTVASGADLDVTLLLDGVAPPSYTYNAGTDTLNVISPPPSTGWVRPSDWIAIPDLTAADERGYFLVVVFENAYNQLGVRITAGAANINWGDGTNIVSTGSTQSKVYDYATLAGAVSVWPDGRNYKQVLVDITRVGGAIAVLDFASPTTIQPRGNNNVVDCVFSFPSLTDLRLSCDNNSNRRAMNLLQRLRVRNTGGVTVLQLSTLVSLQALEWADFEGTVPASLLTSVQVIDLAALNISAAGTAANSMFSTSRIRKVGNITANAVTNAASMFNQCRVLEQVGAVNFALATTLQSYISGCSALTKVGLITAPLNQNLSSFANECYSLEELIFSDCAAVTNTTSMVANCTSLVNLVTPNLTRGVNVSDTSLGLTGMSNFANSLGVASGAQTVTVTSTPFGALLTALDPTAVAIAAVMTGKGYTIAN